MKKIISLILGIIIIVSTCLPSFAEGVNEGYYTIQVEYSDNIGHYESLDVMIRNGNVFADAKMLAERLGYTFDENSEGIVIYNKDLSNGLPFGITQFRYDNKQVSHMLFNMMIDTYTAPFASVKNSEGCWIPLEYSLLLLNSGMMIAENSLLIDIPSKRIIDYFYSIANNADIYNFDWADDFGYTETDIDVIGINSHLINVFNGVLELDGASWTVLFQQFTGRSDAYDEKYGENLAMLLCTESDKELLATIEKVELLNDLLNVDGDLGKLLSFTSDLTEFQVGTLYKQCEAALEGIKKGNSSAVNYSRSYQALENALDRKTLFSHTGENILNIQKGVSDATGETFSFLEIGVKVAEVVGYMQEFQNQDDFSLAALTYYLNNAESGPELPEKMRESMSDYSDTLASNVGEYTVKRFRENVGQWIIDEIPLQEALGTQAAGTLLAWDIASNTIPFINNGLSSADSFELALYSQIFQASAYINYINKRNTVFADPKNVTPENMYELSQYCYIYLKSCYITREAALASLINKTSSTKEKIQPLIDYQNSINNEIARIMVELKGADKTNDNLVFAFMPINNEVYLKEYNDSQLIQWIETFNNKQLHESPSINNETLYADILDKYFYHIQSGWTEYDMMSLDSNEFCYLFPMYYSDPDYINKIGYSFIDLNKDGIDELLIGMDSEEETQYGDIYQNMIYDIYTNMNGEIVHLATSGERFVFQLCEDNTIYYWGTGSAASTAYYHYELSSKEPRLSILEGMCSEAGENGNDILWYHSLSGIYNPETYGNEGEEFTVISESEVISILNTWPKRVDFQLIYFSEYSPQNMYTRSTYENMDYSGVWSNYDSAESMAELLEVTFETNDTEKYISATLYGREKASGICFIQEDGSFLSTLIINEMYNTATGQWEAAYAVVYLSGEIIDENLMKCILQNEGSENTYIYYLSRANT